MTTRGNYDIYWQRGGEAAGPRGLGKFPELFLKCKSRNQAGGLGGEGSGATIIGAMEEKPHS